MKTIRTIKHSILFLLIWMPLFLWAQSPEVLGSWKGNLNVNGAQLSMVYHIKLSENGELKATADSPAQGAFGMPVSEVSFDQGVLILQMTNMQAVFQGKLENQELIKGVFSQRGTDFDMELRRTAQVARPQTPKKPLPYKEKNISFSNKEAGIKLAGTLSLPKGNGPFPVAVLISGSGPQDRNESLFGHKPFFVLSDHLCRNGIAVFRYDDRGTAASKGDFEGATSMDFATDVMAAMDMLKGHKKIAENQIYLIGHSEGGMIAPIVASQRKEVAGIVLMAGPGVSGRETMLSQKKAMEMTMGYTEAQLEASLAMVDSWYDIIVSENNFIQRYSKLDAQLKLVPGYSGSDEADKQRRQQVEFLSSEWIHYFIKHDPAPVLEKTNCAVLAINGEKDIQVLADIQLPAIQAALEKGGNADVTIKSYPELNHLFQHAKTGLPMEYGLIDETIAPEVLDEISSWMKSHIK